MFARQALPFHSVRHLGGQAGANAANYMHLYYPPPAVRQTLMASVAGLAAVLTLMTSVHHGEKRASVDEDEEDSTVGLLSGPTNSYDPSFCLAVC